MCHIPCETSSWACLRALFYQMMRNIVLGSPQGSGAMLLEDLCPSSSFCTSSIAFSLLMWCLCSISHNLLPLQIKRPVSKKLTDPTLTPLLMTLKSLSLPLTPIQVPTGQRYLDVHSTFNSVFKKGYFPLKTVLTPNYSKLVK